MRGSPVAWSFLLVVSFFVGSMPTALACAGAPHTFAFEVASMTVVEGDAPVAIAVLRLGGADCAATVDYALVASTASAGADYVAGAGTLSFASGVSRQAFTLTLADDSVPEEGETVDAVLSNPVGPGGGLADPSRLVVTIVDDDGAPALSLTPSSMDFGGQRVETLSAARTFLLANNGDGRAQGIQVSTPSDYPRTTTCGSTLAPGTHCTIEVRFKPVVSGARPGTLTVSTTRGGTVTASLSGIGQVPHALLSATSLDFGNLPVGATARESASLRNTGTGVLRILNVSTTGDFITEHSCPTTLDPGASCAMTLAFTPASTGTRPGQLRVETDAPDPVRTMALSGVGIDPASAPVMRVSKGDANFTGPLDLGRLQVGSAATERIQLTNDGVNPLTIRDVHVEGTAFTQNTNCPPQLGRSTTCFIDVTFTAHGAGLFEDALTWRTNTDGSPHRIALRAEGFDPAKPPALSVEVEGGATRLSWTGIAVGATSPSRNVTLTSIGGDVVTLDEVRVTNAAFRLDSTCGSTLAPGRTCVLQVAFAPTATGPARGTLVISGTFAGSPRTLELEGTAADVAQPRLTLAHEPARAEGTDTLDFGPVHVPNPLVRTLRVTNDGGAPLTMRAELLGTGFTLDNRCSSVIEAGESCLMHVTFAPTSAGAHSGSLALTTNDPSLPLRLVDLKGLGTSDAPTDASPTPDGASGSATPSAGLLAALSVVAAAALALGRRKK